MSLRYLARDTSRLIRQSLGIHRKPPKPYWEDRQGSAYLADVRRLVNEVGADAQSILDVGSNGCPYLGWFPWIERRVSLDIEKPYIASGIESVKADFITYDTSEPFDIVLCLQVLEHIPDAAAFAQRLLGMARQHLIVSVPYKWPAGKHLDHVQDPVDEAKVAGWLQRKPTYEAVIADGSRNRLVCHYAL